MMKNIMKEENIKFNDTEIVLEVALFLNKQLFDEQKISYKMFKYTEEHILKEFNNIRSI